jgi:glycine/D-amino acid oxidase-like deaminating enzyme
VRSLYDVIVVGAGPAGIAAAVAAAESGAATLLVEAMGECGGSGGPGGVNHWLGGRTKDCRSFVAGGIFRRFVMAAVAEGIAKLPEHHGTEFSPHGWTRGHLTAGVPFDGIRMAEFLERQCLAAGVELLYFTHFVSCRTDGDRIVSLTFYNKSGLFELQARQVIDATGDADVAHAAGCECMLGRDGDHAMAPASLEFHVSHVDADALSAYIRKHSANRFLKEIGELTERGIWKFKYDRLITVQMLEEDVFMVNTNRLTGIDGTDGESVTRGMIEGRRECLELFRIMKEHIPGFAHARLIRFGSALGIRETRRIMGEAMLRVGDLMTDAEIPETIGFVCYNWDLPDPHRPSYQPLHENKTAIRDRIPLPFGIMKPAAIANLLCPGRCVCAERDVLGAVRVMASCMVMGEAAGVSAATGLRGSELQERLSARGCIVF